MPLNRVTYRSLIGPLFVAVAYYVTAAGSLAMTQGLDGIATMWPSSGVLLAALLLAPSGDLALYVVGATIASMMANLGSHNDLTHSIGFTFANMSESVLAAWMLRARDQSIPTFVDPAGVGRFCLAVGTASVMSATIATLIGGGFEPDFFDSWLTTDVLGMLIVTPLILTAADLLSREGPVTGERASIAEMILLFGGVVAVMAVVFAQSSYPLTFLPMVALLVVTYRLGPFGAAGSMLLITLISSVATGMGHGPLTLIVGGQKTIVLFLQFYLLVMLAAALPLAALLETRARLMRELAHAYGVAEETARRATLVADTDQLTGTASRRRILHQIDEAILLARETGKPLAVAIFDIDHFKRINDRYGHSAGDHVLRRVAGAALACIRGADAVGRLGGEEFVVLLPGATSAVAMSIAERVRIAIEMGGSGSSVDPRVTTSIGVACLAGDVNAAALLHRADCALYEGKAGGRNALRLAA